MKYVFRVSKFLGKILCPVRAMKYISGMTNLLLGKNIISWKETKQFCILREVCWLVLGTYVNVKWSSSNTTNKRFESHWKKYWQMPNIGDSPYGRQDTPRCSFPMLPCRRLLQLTDYGEASRWRLYGGKYLKGRTCCGGRALGGYSLAASSF